MNEGNTNNIVKEQTTRQSGNKTVPLPDAPLTGRTVWLMIVAQMEQTIMLVLTTVIGVMMPLMRLYYEYTVGTLPDVWTQGCVAASGLIGVTLGAPILGNIGDRVGYANIFRLCAILILLGGLGAWLIHGSLWWTAASLLLVGLGIGGGYSLDDVYLSELMPARIRNRMIGVAKCIAATGASWSGFVALGIMKAYPNPEYWRSSMAIIAALGAITLLMRIYWWESPKWLLLKGEPKKALKAAQHFLGKDVVPAPLPTNLPKPVSIKELFTGQRLWKVIATGIPWALDGVGAYGLGAFLPMVLIGLGLHMGVPGATGVASVENSVLLTSVLNIFITVGFVIGLFLISRMYHITLMAVGFIISIVAVIVIMCAHSFSWPLWVGITAFIIFETALSAGPGIITFMLPAEVFTPAERGTGSGIAAAMGKSGAILGVFFMPLIFDSWGVNGAMGVCLAAIALGAIVISIAGPKALPRKKA